MTVKEIKHLCDLLAYSERSMEYLFDNPEKVMDCGDDIYQCKETLEQARFTIIKLLDTVKVF